MYDYIKMLQRNFDTHSYENLRELNAHKQLHAALNAEQRKLLLSIDDAYTHQREEARLESFLAGCRFAFGLCRELAAVPAYDNEAAIEATAEVKSCAAETKIREE